MKYYVKINGVSSETIQGLKISELPSISKPLCRSTREEIDGRDGDIITKLGYSAYDKTLKIGLWGNYDINQVIAFFNQEGKITFSNEPNKYYIFTILNRTDFINQLEAFRTASITIHCQPFKYMEQPSPDFDREYVEETGTDLTFNNSVEAPIDIDLKGNTSQTGTPTPSSPIPVNVVSGDNDIVVCGNNLFDMNTISSSSIITINNNQTLTINGTGVGGINFELPRPIILKANTTYTMALSNYYANDKLNIIFRTTASGSNVISVNTASSSITPNEDIALNYLRVFTDGTTTFNNYTTGISIINDNSSTYEAYNGTTYNIDLPVENKFNIGSSSTTQLAITRTYSNSEIILDGTANATSYLIDNNSVVATLPKGTYTMQVNVVSGSISNSNEAFLIKKIVGGTSSNLKQYSLYQTPSDKFQITLDETSDIAIAYWVNSGVKYTNCKIQFQIEQGSKANSYTPYGTTPIELCKIGDYQDYIYKEDDKWYLHKEITKVVLDGSENNWDNWQINNETANTYLGVRLLSVNNLINIIGTIKGYLISNYFSDNEQSSLYSNAIEGVGTTATNLYFKILKTTANSLANFKTWLSTHNTIVYYVLATPTNIEITYAPLVSQLDSIYEAQSKEGITNIYQVNNDLPFIITASVLCGAAKFVVNNIGNTIAKPVMTIEGSGNIGIYLNDIQIFTIALGDEGSITLDIANMEAYKDGILKNRLVVGDYNSFVLQPGNNTISFSGDVVECEIKNYSRWL